MRKYITTALICAAVFGAAFAIWLIGCQRWYRSVQPAGTTLAEHLAHRPPAEDRRVIDVNGQKYLALFGEMAGLPRAPSGPPVYIFDQNGHLADWTADVGDDPNFITRWPNVYSGRPVTPDEVAKWPRAGQ